MGNTSAGGRFVDRVTPVPMARHAPEVDSSVGPSPLPSPLATFRRYEYTSNRWLIGLIRLWFRIFEIVFELRVCPSPTSRRPCGL